MNLVKFRYWDRLNEKMIPHEELDFNKLLKPPPPHGDLMQFTGELDSRGQEIYEGDIIKFYTDELNGWKQFAVYFLGCGFCYGYTNVWSFPPNKRETVVVIGNIFENPELKFCDGWK